jgi:four helix bundle protein
MRRFTELKVWQRGHAHVPDIYRLSVGFPMTERYGLLSQFCRAALLVPTSVARGSKRVGPEDYARFLNIAEAARAETAYLLMVSRDLGYITPQQAITVFRDVAELAKMLHGLRQKVDPSK